MKPFVRNRFVIVALILTAVGVYLATRDHEPSYSGKPLSVWLNQLDSKRPRLDHEAITALRAMGEPAIRRLIHTVESSDSDLTLTLSQLPVMGDLWPARYWHRYLATTALGEIGANAATAIPTLEALRHQADPNLSRAASAALVLIRNDSIASIVADYADYANTNSSKAFGLLLALGPHAREAVPVLLRELQSTNERIRLRASILLRGAAIESPEGVSIFTNLLSDANNSVRVQAIGGLANCGAMAKAAAPLVAKFLDDPDDAAQSSALVFLWTVLSPEELSPFRAKVETMTSSTNETTRIWAERLLRDKPAVR